MNVTSSPNSRFGWEGTPLEYVVKADGATELRLKQGLEGCAVRVTDVQKTAKGVVARVRVDVAKGAFV